MGDASRKGLERDKRGKDGSKYGVLKWGMCELVRGSLQLPNVSLSENE